MGEGELEDKYFAAFAEPTRRRVVEALSAGARRAGELAALAGVSPATMSRHLRFLLEAGIVDDERSVVDARVRLFFLRREPIAAVASWANSVLGGRAAAARHDAS